MVWRWCHIEQECVHLWMSCRLNWRETETAGTPTTTAMMRRRRRRRRAAGGSVTSKDDDTSCCLHWHHVHCSLYLLWLTADVSYWSFPTIKIKTKLTNQLINPLIGWDLVNEHFENPFHTFNLTRLNLCRCWTVCQTDEAFKHNETLSSLTDISWLKFR